MTRRLWTESDREVLRRTYADYPTENIARSLGRTVGQVRQQAQALGLHKSAAFIASMSRAQSLRPDHGGHATRFQPGLAPANKGLRRPGYSPGEMGRTQFKPGRAAHESANYVPIGSLRINADGHLERKVTDDKSFVPARRWVAEHRLVWESVHGQVPAGQVVVFRAGQFTTEASQITADRLECLTRAELMRRNTIHRYPEPVKQVMRLRGQLSRAIAAQEDQS